MHITKVNPSLYNMVLKRLLIVFLAIHLTNSVCVNENVEEEFDKSDEDENGYLTEDEVMKACSAEDQDEKQCQEAWKAVDWKLSGKVTCQGRYFKEKLESNLRGSVLEYFVGWLTLKDDFKGQQSGEQLKKIMKDKSEDCTEIPIEKVVELAEMTWPTTFDASDKMLLFLRFADMSRNKIISCNGKFQKSIKKALPIFDTILFFAEFLLSLFLSTNEQIAIWRQNHQP